MSRLVQRLFAPIDAASLAAFRILFGGAMLVDMLLYTREKIEYHWLLPKFLFKYYGFEWVQVLPGDGMVYLVWALRVLALLIMAGLFYRPAAILFFCGFTYTFLIDQAEHLNHSYMICLVSFLMIFVPANATFSLDAKRKGTALRDVPAWTVGLLRFQIGVVYFFGGIAKLNSDWLQGEPVRQWLAGRADYPFVGHFFTSDVTVYFFAYGGLVFDILVAPMLCFRRTRPWILPPLVFFHLTNAWLFDIGIFPWLMLVATTIFFDPDWPRRLFKLPPSGSPHPVSPRRYVVVLLCIYIAIQVAMPLRHWLYPGNVNWTEEGHRFSWRMKLRSKFGSAHFFVTDPASRRTWMVDPRQYINPIQAMRMSARPDMVQQMAKFIAREMEKKGYANVEVRVRDMLSLNGRRPQLLIDPTVDLAAEPRTLRPVTWLLPLTEPLPAPGSYLFPPEERENVARQLQERRALQHELTVLGRMIDQKTASLRAVDRDLQARFKVDAAADYRFDADSRTLFRRDGDIETAVMAIEEAPDRRLFKEMVARRALLRRQLATLHGVEAQKIAAEGRLYDFDASDTLRDVE
jgi:vitamin K-dependent gamma-carboxylase